MKKLIIFAFFYILLSLTLVSSVHAAGAPSDCEVLNGGGEICPEKINFSIDKKVLPNGKGASFTDNLSSSDGHFNPNDTVTFQITVKNDSNGKIENLTVVDTLPQELSYQSGVTGNFNSNNNTISWTIDSIEGKKSKTYTITAKVKDFSGASVQCTKNMVKVADKKGVNRSDSSSFCLEKKAAPTPVVQIPSGPSVQPQPGNVNKMPPTGPEDFVLPLLTASGALGFYLNKKSK